MKKQKTIKKLSLSKKTISNLGSSGMSDAKGAGTMTCGGCPTAATCDQLCQGSAVCAQNPKTDATCVPTCQGFTCDTPWACGAQVNP